MTEINNIPSDNELLDWYYNDTLEKVKAKGFNSIEEFIASKSKENQK